MLDKDLSSAKGKKLIKKYGIDINGHGAISIEKQLLNESGWEKYLEIKNSAMEKYLEIKKPAWEKYLEIKKTAMAMEKYEEIEKTAWEKYEEIKKPAMEKYEAKAKLEFWKIFKQKKYRNKAWI